MGGLEFYLCKAMVDLDQLENMEMSRGKRLNSFFLKVTRLVKKQQQVIFLVTQKARNQFSISVRSEYVKHPNRAANGMEARNLKSFWDRAYATYPTLTEFIKVTLSGLAVRPNTPQIP